MIQVPGFRGAAFTTAVDGDGTAQVDRAAMSDALSIDAEWATVRQVHGSEVIEATYAGSLGDADAIFTTRVAIPVAIFTADCVPMIVEADAAVGVAHAGWRGLVAGVGDGLLDAMADGGHVPRRVAIGPAIGSCCYEVGPEVAEKFSRGSLRRTSWGSQSVDLVAEVRHRLPDGLSVWCADVCTKCGDGMFSHRRDGTSRRMAAVGWLT